MILEYIPDEQGTQLGAKMAATLRAPAILPADFVPAHLCYISNNRRSPRLATEQNRQARGLVGFMR